MVTWSDKSCFVLNKWIAGYIGIIILWKWWHQDALWCFGLCLELFPNRTLPKTSQCVLSFIWKVLFHIPSTTSSLKTSYITPQHILIAVVSFITTPCFATLHKLYRNSFRNMKAITVLPWLLNLTYRNYVECLWLMLDHSAKHPPCKWHQLKDLLYYVTSRHYIQDETTSDLVEFIPWVRIVLGIHRWPTPY